jgi:tRNA pseudouridine13 synthase
MTESISRLSAVPFEPPLVTRTLLPVAGRLGTELDDFRVEEIPAYLPSGEGDHRYIHLEKRGLSTPEAVALIARAADVKERDIGTAGLKDKHAVTTQWLSLPKQSRPVSEWNLPESLRVLTESLHQNKLRTGHLHGNIFRVRLLEISAESQLRLPALLERLRRGTLNAFAEQRFGRDGQNIQSALDWLKDPRSLRGPKARFLSKFYPSVIQSELFNRYLAARLALGEDRLLQGEIVRLEGTGSNFVVEDLSTEQARFERGELHPQGPIFGPRMRPAKAEALALEEQVLAEVGLTTAELDQLGSHAPGTRRDLWLKLKDLEANFETAHPREASTSPDALRLSFSLPAGSYATHVVRELTHSPWFERRSRATAMQSTPSEADTQQEPSAALEQ